MNTCVQHLPSPETARDVPPAPGDAEHAAYHASLVDYCTVTAGLDRLSHARPQGADPRTARSGLMSRGGLVTPLFGRNSGFVGVVGKPVDKQSSGLGRRRLQTPLWGRGAQDRLSPARSSKNTHHTHQLHTPTPHSETDTNINTNTMPPCHHTPPPQTPAPCQCLRSRRCLLAGRRVFPSMPTPRSRMYFPFETPSASMTHERSLIVSRDR